jgi:hypothetical protein
MVTNNTLAVCSADVTLTTSAVIVLPQVIDIREALSGLIQLKYKSTTAPGTGKILHVYILHSLDGVNFDEAVTASMIEVGNFAMANDTADHLVPVPLDGVTLTGKDIKVAIMADAASNYGVLRKLDILTRKAV